MVSQNNERIIVTLSKEVTSAIRKEAAKGDTSVSKVAATIINKHYGKPKPNTT